MLSRSGDRGVRPKFPVAFPWSRRFRWFYIQVLKNTTAWIKASLEFTWSTIISEVLRSFDPVER